MSKIFGDGVNYFYPVPKMFRPPQKLQLMYLIYFKSCGIIKKQAGQVCKFPKGAFNHD